MADLVRLSEHRRNKGKRVTFDLPVFTVAKRTGNGRHCDYLLFSGREQIKHGQTIGEVLSIFNRPLRLISHR